MVTYHIYLINYFFIVLRIKFKVTDVQRPAIKQCVILHWSLDVGETNPHKGHYRPTADLRTPEPPIRWRSCYRVLNLLKKPSFFVYQFPKIYISQCINKELSLLNQILKLTQNISFNFFPMLQIFPFQPYYISQYYVPGSIISIECLL